MIKCPYCTKETYPEIKDGGERHEDGTSLNRNKCLNCNVFFYTTKNVDLEMKCKEYRDKYMNDKGLRSGEDLNSDEHEPSGNDY